MFTKQIPIFQEGMSLRRTDTIFPGAMLCVHQTDTDFPGATEQITIFQQVLFKNRRTETDFPEAPL